MSKDEKEGLAVVIVVALIAFSCGLIIGLSSATHSDATWSKILKESEERARSSDIGESMRLPCHQYTHVP